MKDTKNHNNYAQTPTKIGLSRLEAAAYIGIGKTKFDELVSSGTMPKPRTIGSRKIWVRPELETSLITLPTNDNKVPNSWDGIL